MGRRIPGKTGTSPPFFALPSLRVDGKRKKIVIPA